MVLKIEHIEPAKPGKKPQKVKKPESGAVKGKQETFPPGAVKVKMVETFPPETPGAFIKGQTYLMEADLAEDVVSNGWGVYVVENYGVQSQLAEQLSGSIEQLTPPLHKPSLLPKQQTAEEMLVDEFVLLHEFLEKEEVAKALKRYETIKKELHAKAKDMNADPSQPVVFPGELGTVTLSPCKNMTVVADKDGLLTKIGEKCGAEAALSVVKIGITEVGKLLSAAESAPFVVTEPGPRTTSVIVHKKDSA